jgi:hypothetical protein
MRGAGRQDRGDARQAGHQARRSRSFTKTPARESSDTWQKKYAEVMDGLDRAEALWVAAAEKLEEAEAR